MAIGTALKTTSPLLPEVTTPAIGANALEDPAAIAGRGLGAAFVGEAVERGVLVGEASGPLRGGLAHGEALDRPAVTRTLFAPFISSPLPRSSRLSALPTA